MNKRRALHLGFAPYTADLFGDATEPPGYWKRTLQRPRCAQYWHPEQPNRLRMRRLDANGRAVGEMMDTVSPSMRRTLQGANSPARRSRSAKQPATSTRKGNAP